MDEPQHADFPVLGALDLRLTLGGGGPSKRHGSQESAVAGRWPAGPASLSLQVVGDRLQARAWGPGAAEALAAVPALCGLHDPGALALPRHPVLDQARRRAPGLRLGRTGRMFEALVPWVVGQRVTGAGAHADLQDLVRRFGEPAPGPAGLQLLPSPQTLAGLSPAALHPCGIELARARTLLRLGREADRLERTLTLPRKEAYAALVALPGIGPWTAAHAMARAWGDADAVPLGDYHLPSTIAWHLAGERIADDIRMVELLRPFQGQRWRVIRFLLQLGDRSPRRGARTETGDIRGL